MLESRSGCDVRARWRPDSLGLGLASAVLLFGVLACTPKARDYTSGTGGAGGAGGAGGMGGAGGSVPCPETHRCAVPPPDGWSAPAAVVTGVPSPACPESFPTLLVDVRDDIAAEPAACGCSCGAPSVDCGNLLLLYHQSCGAPVGLDVASGPPNTCLDSTPKQNSVHAYFNEVMGPCTPAPTTTLPEPSSQSAVRACGGASTDGVCEDGLLCVPEPVTPFRICVVRGGEHPCPPGYPDRAIHYEGVNDTRACTECTCGAPADAKCSASVQGYSDACATATSALVTDDQCTSSFSYYTYTTPEVTEPGACPPGTVEPTGTVELADPITFCCSVD
ncbi:hypothetical protein [Polyangium jinanense]|uniref:Uncharacterized protein n=1 Tax=Polyangium jinanense TaxID=2829994 RepID=A0A9X4AU32_9BACT|nr:hypothetical protein [Polyangium jinanense]MDC3956119.1 hypothetical protein [Polyangium jinanense]MDC3982850.1 hypothetical protein [Polyangium jinanense]